MKRTSALLTGLLVLGLASCASLKLPAPVDRNSTLLVLPITMDSTSQHGGQWSFHFIYDIVSDDGAAISHQAIFTRREPENIMLVDSLPPGVYRLRSLSFVPAGVGDHRYGNNSQTRYERFRLEAGKITIFPRQLAISRYNPIPGRGLSTTYSQDMLRLTKDENVRIVNTLRAQPGFDQWQFQYLSPIVARIVGMEPVGKPVLDAPYVPVSEPVPEISITPEPAAEPAAAGVSSISAGESAEASEPEVVSSESVASATRSISGINLSGRYRSQISSTSIFIFPRRFQTTEITLTHSGSRISGADDAGLFEISGDIEEGVVRFYVKPSTATGFYDIFGEWELLANGKNLVGFWKDSRGDGPGDWNLIRID